MKKYLALGLITLGLLFFANSTFATTTIFSDSFGSVSTDDVPGWVDGGGDNVDDTYTTNGTSLPSSSTTHQARVRDGGYIINTISTIEYENIILKYYWHGDDDGDGASDNLKVYWKKTSDPTFLLLNTHQLDGNDLWSSEVSVSLPSTAENTSIDIKFLGDSNANTEEGRIDDVGITGDAIITTGNLTVIKNTLGGDGTFEFTGTGDIGEFDIETEEGTGNNAINDLTSGTYTISETVPDGWDLTDISCEYDGESVGESAPPNGETVTIDPGDTVTCTFTNTKQGQGTITVVKNVVNDNGGDADSDDFTLLINESEVTNGQANFLEPDEYTISEDAESVPEGYTQTSIICTNGEETTTDGSVTLGEQDAWTCTITNDDQPGTLTVKKVVINDNDGTKTISDFSFKIGSQDAVNFETDGQNDVTVNAGTYDITEPEVSGYTTTYENCSNVVIINGGSATCIITNDDVASPTISEQTVTSIKQTYLVVTWTTSHPATSRLIYDTVSHPVLGAAPNYGYANSTVEDATLVTSHSVTFSGLTSGTTYFLRTVSHGSPEGVSSELGVMIAGSGGGTGLAGGNNPPPSPSPAPAPAGQVLGASTETPLPVGEVLGVEKFIFTQYMKLGSKYGEVSELEKRLMAEGFYKGAIDGKFGKLLQQAVKDYQKAHPPLKVDGIVGPKTRAVLNA